MSRRLLIRIIILLACIWMVLLGIVYISGGKYRDHLIFLIKDQISRQLNTEIYIHRNDIKLNLLRNFPYGTIELKNIFVRSAPGCNLEEFNYVSGDTLLYAEKISLLFNLKSILSGNYTLNKIDMDNASINLLKDRKGFANYNIIKVSEREAQDSIKIDLRDIDIRHADIYYSDLHNGTLIKGHVKKSEMAGVFTGDLFSLKTGLEIDEASLKVNRNEILTNENIALRSKIGRKANIYSFTDGMIRLFGIEIKAQGTYDDEKRSYNFRMGCSSAPINRMSNGFIKKSLGGIPFKPAGGTVDLKINIAGGKRGLPNYKIDFLVREGVLKHHDKKLKAEKIYAKGNYDNIQAKSTLVFDSLYVKSGGSSLAFKGSIVHMNSPVVKGRLYGNLELEKLNSIKAIGSKMELAGNITLSLSINGPLPISQKISFNEIQKLKITGNINLEEVAYNPLNNQVSVLSGSVDFRSLSNIDLNGILLKRGESDLEIDGMIKNLPYFISDHSQFPVLEGSIASNNFRVEDFMSVSGSNNIGFNFPDSLTANATVLLKSFSFGNFSATDVSGKIHYFPKTLVINDFLMNSQKGIIRSNISLTQQTNLLWAHFTTSVAGVDIKDLFFACNNFGQKVITHNYISGTVTGNAIIDAAWTLELKPRYDLLRVTSDIVIKKGELTNYQPLYNLSDYIELDELKHIKFNDLAASITIAESKANLGQTSIVSSAISITGSGEHDFKNNYEYRIQVRLADILWKKAKKKKLQDEEFGYVLENERKYTLLPLVISGKDTVFDVRYDRKTAGTGFKERIDEEKRVWQDLTAPAEVEKQPNLQYKINWPDNSSVEEEPDIEDEAIEIRWDDD